MSEESLYREVKCPQCGGTHLAGASFCPHCGHVKGGGWFEKISNTFRSGEPSSGLPSHSGVTLRILMSAALGLYFMYVGIAHESPQGIVAGLLLFFFAVRSWFSPSKPSPSSINGPGTHEKADVPPENLLENKFYCENCSAQVPSEALECPNCGMKFGG